MEGIMRILSGTRPTGRLHIGNYVGALQNWVKLQNQGHETFYFVADWHVLTTAYDKTEELAQMTKEVVKTFIAVGLDPEKSVLFVQSGIKEHAELCLFLSMITSVPRLERVPTHKEMREQLQTSTDINTSGFLMYPVLQAADILMYLADGVPVGEDQLSHVELTREIARRFNYIYQKEIFIEPQSLLSNFPKLLGCDGRKMSKSYGNIILIDSNERELSEQILPMVTDPARKRKTDPGNPEICPVWDYHKAFGVSEDEKETIFDGCTNAKIGCIECKRILLKNMISTFSPVWERFRLIEQSPGFVEQVIRDGNDKARKVAENTMEKVRSAIHLYS
jgi:tryptophanyl-tRNA synthetase